MAYLGYDPCSLGVLLGALEAVASERLVSGDPADPWSDGARQRHRRVVASLAAFAEPVGAVLRGDALGRFAPVHLDPSDLRWWSVSRGGQWRTVRDPTAPAGGPRLSPAVIVRVTRGDEILLARARRFPGRLYSVLAGFVEPGESLEECVARELEEEVGIEVAEITYFASQPWPFPHSLMIGFTATWVSGDLRIEEAELLDAGWFTRDNLPDLPGRVSIARRLIDDWL